MEIPSTSGTLHEEVNKLNAQAESVNTNKHDDINSSSTSSENADFPRSSSSQIQVLVHNDANSLPPTYWQIPGTVPISAGTGVGPPPTYEEVVNPDAPPPSYQSLFGQVQNARKNSKTIPDFIKNLIFIALGTIGVTIYIASTILIPFTMIIVGASNISNCPAENIPQFLLIGGTVWITRNILNFLKDCSSVRIGRDTSAYAFDDFCAQQNNGRTSTSAGTSASGACSQTNASSSDYPCANASSPIPSTSESRNRNRFVINLDHDEDISRVINEYQPIKNHRREFLMNTFIFLWFFTGCVMVYRIFPPEYTDSTKSNYCNKAVYLYAFWLVTSVFIVFGLFVSCLCCVSITAIFSAHGDPARRSSSR